ncbi:uncharacterized protein LOC103703595 [Phoenix dactylifera]|uniref:Uncharacterized protein LOC103703595 n=2 Tax=Liliopsida TaxID=4447 RepID=A0A8B9A2I8_PHODC|nr:uncharacterized protein LOC103703595 [Phoenix dactylifera]
MAHVSDIKLIRTDTTLDLSQKAEKGMLETVPFAFFYRLPLFLRSYLFRCGTKTQLTSRSNCNLHVHPLQASMNPSCDSGGSKRSGLTPSKRAAPARHLRSGSPRSYCNLADEPEILSEIIPRRRQDTSRSQILEGSREGTWSYPSRPAIVGSSTAQNTGAPNSVIHPPARLSKRAVDGPTVDARGGRRIPLSREGYNHDPREKERARGEQRSSIAPAVVPASPEGVRHFSVHLGIFDSECGEYEGVRMLEMKYGLLLIPKTLATLHDKHSFNEGFPAARAHPVY